MHGEEDPTLPLLGPPGICPCDACKSYHLLVSCAEAGLIENPGVPEAHTVSQGKVAELRQELVNPTKKDKNHNARKNALKKIVANMTMSNNDMVALFPDIIACMQIPNLEIKKMYEERTFGHGQFRLTNQGHFYTCSIMPA